MSIPDEFIKPRLLVDTSYAIYFTMFSVWGWFKEEFNIVPDYNYDPTTSAEFTARFKEKFISSILWAAKNVYPMSSLKNAIFALDTRRSDIWRNEFFPQYKLARKLLDKKEQEFNFNGSFNYIKNVLLPNLIEEYPGLKVISVPCCEGDDIIAVCAKELKDEYKLIIASDKDLIQLLNQDNKLRFVNMMGKEITLKGVSEKITPLKSANHILTAKEFLLMKILMGDKSDSIQPVYSRLGESTAAKYILNKEKIGEMFEKNPAALKQFNLNKKIIDLNNIPEELYKNIALVLNEETQL
jgi:5'-3' exonuclease